jgi:plasmid stability protein
MSRDLSRDLARAALRPATQVRLDETLRRYLVIVAARDGISMSQAIRDRLYAALEAEPRVKLQGARASLSFRAIVDSAEDDAIEDLAEQLREGATA